MRLFTVFLFLALSSCGVRDPLAGNVNPQATPSGTPTGMPEGILMTSQKVFLVKPSRLDFQVSPTYEVQYQFVERNLEAIGEGVTLKVVYWMPDMPQMPVTPAKITRVGDGKFLVTYDISMEGHWEFKLELYETGSAIDSLTTQYEVPPLS